MSGVSSVTINAFVDPGARLELDEPRQASFSWILHIGDRNEIHLHFRDKADLYRLVDEITAKAGSR